ncbi:hypothetical protein EC991_006699 [Linnemannia zychae]|nr:hypothetical protein EC991_006699 [Linnemannia zychae]
MTAIAHPPSKVGPSTYFLHNNKANHPPTPLSSPIPARVVQCGICLDDFEWFSLKDLNGYQEDPKDTNIAPTKTTTTITPTTITSGSSLPQSQICNRRFHFFCSHSRHAQAPIRARHDRTNRWTGAIFGGHKKHTLREQKLKQVAASSPSVEVLKLGCSLHTGKDHAFCLECLARYIDIQVKAQVWPINCPHDECREAVCSFAVETLLGSDALQWHRLAVEHAIQKKIYCPYTACARLIDGDRNDAQEPVDRHCPYCNKPFCAMCFSETHKGINCQQRMDKIFDTLATQNNWKSCPSCHHMIQKESGTATFDFVWLSIIVPVMK